MPKNADQTPNAELVKLASQAKEIVFAEEVTIEILKLDDAKISMNVYPVPNRFVDLMLYAIISLEVMSANAHLDFLEIHSADVKNVQVRKLKIIISTIFITKHCLLKMLPHFWDLFSQLSLRR